MAREVDYIQLVTAVGGGRQPKPSLDVLEIIGWLLPYGSQSLAFGDDFPQPEMGSNALIERYRQEMSVMTGLCQISGIRPGTPSLRAAAT